MSAYENVITLAQEWQPEVLPTEAKYRDSLIAFLRQRMKPDIKIESEYRHCGTTTDIYVQQFGFLGPSDVFVELKRNLTQKSQLDRLIGQLECLLPRKNYIIVVLCGETNPALVARLKAQYGISEGVLWTMITVLLKPAKKPTAKRLAALSLLAALSTPHAQAQSRNAPPSWPKDRGVYISTSSESIPAFPRTLSGYRSENDKDFWNKPFHSRGTVRIFQGNEWQGLPKFPNTMNGCSSGVFMIRWRSANQNVLVQSSARYSKDIPGTMKAGNYGYMSGTNCEQPMFKFESTRDRDKSTLVDVYYELKFWQAAP
jgi:hypothetical protein